jgi:PHD/YefM family antitoxin component YafN of YafNO toxin-antitoxin module
MAATVDAPFDARCADMRELYKIRRKLYASFMASINISAARGNLPGVVEQARTEAVFLERYGQTAAVVISPERYAQLIAALEEAEDVAAFDAAMADEGPNIPWAEAKADLGWG